MTFQASEAVREAAIARDDDQVLLELQCGPDAIAAEVQYHHFAIVPTLTRERYRTC